MMQQPHIKLVKELASLVNCLSKISRNYSINPLCCRSHSVTWFLWMPNFGLIVALLRFQEQRPVKQCKRIDIVVIAQLRWRVLFSEKEFDFII